MTFKAYTTAVMNKLTYVLFNNNNNNNPICKAPKALASEIG